MSKTLNIDYPVGTTFQPNEHSLVLTIDDLHNLNQKLITLGDNPKRVSLGNMIIQPVE